MSTLSLSRALVLSVPLGILLAACNRNAYQPDMLAESQQLELGGPGMAAEVYGTMTDHPCPNIYEPPCADGTGCSPVDGTVITDGPPYAAPEFSWTYGCNPDGYQLTLRCTDPVLCDMALITTNVTSYDPSIHGPRRSYDPEMTLAPGYYTWRISAFQSDIFPDNWYYSTTNSFWVGETCTDADDLPEVSLGLPYEGQVIKTHQSSLKVDFSWYVEPVHPAGCLPDDFNGQIATDPDFTENVVNIVTYAGLMTHGESEHELSRCRTYYWRVRSMLDGVGGPWSETQSFKIRPAGDGFCWFDVIFMAKVDVTCRVGPGTLYGRTAYLPAGESHPLDGRNADGTWLHLLDLNCYVNGELGELEPPEGISDGADLIGQLPVLPDPPLPVAEPTKEPRSGPTCTPDLGKTECAAAGGFYACFGSFCICTCP